MNHRLAQLWETKTKTKDDEWWSSFVTSPLAIVINYFVVDFKWLTPNKVTFISFLFAIMAAVFIIAGDPQYFILAAVLIQLSHVFDCMDGQMARYRKTTSMAGSYYDKLSDEIKVSLWFGAMGYLAYSQTHQMLPILLTFVGVAAYTFKGYVKYVSFYTQMGNNKNHLIELSAQTQTSPKGNVAGLGFGFLANLRWFMLEQRKIINVNEGVFIFMLSLAIVLNPFIPDSILLMLWVFAISQVMLAIDRALRKGSEISALDHPHIL